MLHKKLVHKEDYIFVWDQILEIKHFLEYFEEFNELNNNWRFNKSVNPSQDLYEREVIEKPLFGGISKPGNQQGIGDNINLLDLSSRLKIIAEQTLRVKLDLIRVNTNIQFFGQETKLHTDAPSDNFWTFLIFFNINWLAEHGGEFLIVKPDNTTFSSLPIPNRGILFRADLPHKGCAPNRFCGRPRFSVASTYCEAPN